MKPLKSKAIVVDASIARSAGLTENPTSIICRQVLQTMLDYCHRVIITDAIWQEWEVPCLCVYSELVWHNDIKEEVDTRDQYAYL